MKTSQPPCSQADQQRAERLHFCRVHRLTAHHMVGGHLARTPLGRLLMRAPSGNAVSVGIRDAQFDGEPVVAGQLVPKLLGVRLGQRAGGGPYLYRSADKKPISANFRRIRGIGRSCLFLVLVAPHGSMSTAVLPPSQQQGRRSGLWYGDMTVHQYLCLTHPSRQFSATRKTDALNTPVLVYRDGWIRLWLAIMPFRNIWAALPGRYVLAVGAGTRMLQ